VNGLQCNEPSSFPRRRESSVFAIFLLFALNSSLSAQDFSALDAAAGQALFERNWVMAPASTAATDGLGPYYNARSCFACHADGGGGDDALTSMNLFVGNAAYGELLQLRAVTGMEPEARAELVYEPAATVTLPDGSEVELRKPRIALSEMQHGELSFISSLRRAPALAGLALLEQVPLAQLQQLADPDDRDGDGISGRIAEGKGRFGWKASAASLREQVARALSLDLGLGSSLFPAPAGDCTEQQLACHDAARSITGDPLEAPDTVVNLLLAYLQTLSPPAPVPVTGQGAELFTTLGCPACHTPQLDAAGQTLQPFTDLLLHDLGPGLGAAPESAAAAEWRTAPLWGLGRSSHFLHDGRAASLAEALLWHGGEAAPSAEAYRRLNAGQRAVLHQWLLGL
jgi:CxxC motif-containing protein (DUF1111 family)